MSRKGVYITERNGMAVIKLDSGYNIGVPPSSCTLTERPAPVPPKQIDVFQDKNLPTLAIVSTGGTIASRIDYRTGSVTSQFNASDTLTAIPELKEIANYRTIPLASILSENMTPAIWQELARAIHAEIRNGAKGVIVTHGTDTMAYSAAAISFMIDTPVPIVFVGSQRSADRPSSDNAMNAVCAAAAATSDLGEVVVVMHATTDDDTCAIHRGTRVRKMHTSRRDAFRSLGIPPIGEVDYSSRNVTLTKEAVRRGTQTLALHDALDPHCALIQFYPGMSANLRRRMRDTTAL
jgi:glutamyl-tRNA(Gln) amidotransferase subunit D